MWYKLWRKTADHYLQECAGFVQRYELCDGEEPNKVEAQVLSIRTGANRDFVRLAT